MTRLFLLVLLVSACSATPMTGPPPVEPPPDAPVDVVAEMKTACEADDSASCLNMALRHERGDGVTQDVTAATRYYEQACDLGSAHACYGQAMILLYEHNNPIRAHLLLEYTCNAKHWPSCVVLGDLHRDNLLLGKDEHKSLALYQQACDGGYDAGCNAYIAMVWTASDQLVKLQEFARRLESACESGHAPSCQELSKLYADGTRWMGDELAADQVKAQLLQKRAAQLRRVAYAEDDFAIEVKVPKSDVTTHEEATTPPETPFQPGYLVVSGPKGAAIFVDGVETTRIVPANVLIVTGGLHRVRLEKAQGGFTKEVLVFVESGRSIEVAF